MIARSGENDQNRFAQTASREGALIRALGSNLADGHFFSHRSAALLWGIPLPYRPGPDLHLAAVAPQSAPRIRGVMGHQFPPGRVATGRPQRFPATDPASTFVTLGSSLTLPALVAAGDYLVRMNRKGHGRRNAGRPPIATIDELATAVHLGRWQGASKLRRALELIREDAWSPRESLTRIALVEAGLPEPELNVDLFDRAGVFLGCVDMVYPRYKLIIEYQGVQHSETYAADIERFERLRAEGWIVLQVTKALANNAQSLTVRVAQALRSRGWDGNPLA